MSNTNQVSSTSDKSGEDPQVRSEIKSATELGDSIKPDLGPNETSQPNAAKGQSGSVVAQKAGNTNALRHGAYHHGLLAWESKKDFEEMIQKFMADLKPRGMTQEQTVLSIADWTWRRQRVLQMGQIRSGSITLDDVIRPQSEQPIKCQETDVQRQVKGIDSDVASLASKATKLATQSTAASAGPFDRAYRPQEIETEIKLVSMIDREIDIRVKRYFYLRDFEDLEASREARQIATDPQAIAAAPSIIAGECTEVTENALVKEASNPKPASTDGSSSAANGKSQFP
jgi:hypothetical protein